MPWHYRDIQTHKYEKMGRWKGETFKEYIREKLACYSAGMSTNMKCNLKFVNVSGNAHHDITTTCVDRTTIQTCKATIWFHEVNNTIGMTPGCICLLYKSGQTRQRRPCQSTNITIFQNLSSIGHRGSVCVKDGQSQCLHDTGVRRGPSSPEWVWHQTSPLGMAIVVSHHGQWATLVPRGVQGLHLGH
jgi:hypothetical protein